LNNEVVANNLSIEINEKRILNNISFRIPSGYVVGVVGSTGSGKSTLLKAVTGLIPYLYKRFKVYGDLKIYGYSPIDALSNGLIAYVPQDPYSFFIGSTAREEASILDIDISSLDIGNIDVDRDLYKLSDGQLYRLLLYIAIVKGSKIIVLDEPTSHIDWWSIEDIFKLIKSFAYENNVTVFIADHRIELLKRFSDYMIYLDDVEDSCVVDEMLDANREDEEIAVLKNIKFSFNDNEILKNVSIAIRRGESIAIVGKNGSGKTTLLKILIGVLKGRGYRYVSKDVRFFMVPQNPVYWLPGGTVYSVIKRFLEMFRSRESIDSISSLFHLDKDLDKNVYSLSIGKVRTLSVALAYISNADIVIFDEPTLGLDCRYKKLVARIIRILIEKGSAVVIATHDRDFAKIFKSVYSIDGGVLKKGIGL